MGLFSSISRGLSNIDPTTSEGLTNLATGGIIGGTLGPSDALAELDDAISGQDQKDAARDAASAQESAARERLGLDTRIYEEGQAKLDPFYQKGLGTLDDYFNLISPEGADQFRSNYLQGEQFQKQLGAGLDQIASNAAFGGALGAGGTLKNVGDYATDQAFNLPQQALDRELGRLGAGVGIGQSAAGAQVSAGQNFGRQAGSALQSIGDAQATRTLAGAPSGIAPYLQLAGTGAQIYGATV